MAFRAASKGYNSEQGSFQTAPPTAKIAPVIMDFNS